LAAVGRQAGQFPRPDPGFAADQIRAKLCVASLLPSGCAMALEENLTCRKRRMATPWIWLNSRAISWCCKTVRMPPPKPQLVP